MSRKPPKSTKQDVENEYLRPTGFTGGLTRLDAWENSLTGVGTRDRDKQQMLRFQRPRDLTFDWLQLQSLYHFDPLSRRIVDVWPRHMMRNGWDLNAGSGSPLSGSSKDQIAASDIALVEENADELGALEMMLQGQIWGGLYGGALGLIGANDGQSDLSQPLQEDQIQSIDYINVVDRRYVTTSHYFSDYMQPNYGKPSVYRVFRSIVDYNDTNSQALFDIHASRVIRFEGTPVDVIERQRLGGWSHSVLQAPYEEIKRFMQTFQSASHLLTDASQGVYKLKGLMSKLATKSGQNLLYTRMQMMDMARSVARSLLIDADGEEFTRVQTSFQSIPDMLDRFMQMLSMVTGIPVTLLMGRSAAGMNATGDSDFRAFYDEVAARQRNDLAPQLRRLYKLLTLAKNGPTAGKAVNFKFDFRPLWNPTDKEKAEANFIQAQADEKWIINQMLTPAEASLSRFRNGRTNFGTWIIAEDRESALRDGVQFENMDGSTAQPEDGSQMPSGNASEPANQVTGSADGAATGGPGASMGRAKPDSGSVTETRRTHTVVKYAPQAQQSVKSPNKTKQKARADATEAEVAEGLIHLDALRKAGKGIAAEVYASLLADYPPRSLDWVLAAQWKGPKNVPLAEIDFSQRHSWRSTRDDIKPYAKRLREATDAGEHPKPAVLVCAANSSKYYIVDGHHRTLAAVNEQQPVWAYIADVQTEHGPWETLHYMQKKGEPETSSYVFEQTNNPSKLELRP